MDYIEKVKHAERIAQELKGEKTSKEIVSELSASGLYPRDINAVMVSARKMLGKEIKPKIKEILLSGEDVLRTDELMEIDREQLQILISQERDQLSLIERKKISNLMKEGLSKEEVLNQIDLRFLSREKAIELILNSEKVINQNSGLGRSANILGGIGVLVLTGLIALVIGRVYFIGPVIGLGLILKGLLTERMAYEE